jgi:tRNA(His) guanylyltransferase
VERDALGDRMKAQYENRTRVYLPRRTYTIVRVDGKAFHTYCRGLQRPYDFDLMRDMDRTATALCEAMQGARLAYVQSDEISVLLTDFESTDTEAWFDGNLQKIVSIAASCATAAFNSFRQGVTSRLAMFDARAFTIPDPVEVENYFVWRQQDATRNSISMAAQAQFGRQQLHGVSGDQMQEMLWREKGINWNDYPAGARRGRAVVRETYTTDVTYVDKRTQEERIAQNVTRSRWVAVDSPIFTKDRGWLSERIPTHWTAKEIKPV